MKTLVLFLTMIAYKSHLAQSDPVKWVFSIRKLKPQLFELRAVAEIQPGWHLFSQSQPKNAISIPTKINFLKNPLVTLIDKTKEDGELKVYKDEVLRISDNRYEGKLTFIQVLAVRPGVTTYINGKISYQACTDEKCLPTKMVAFNLKLE